MPKSRPLELLAPAKDKETAIAAIVAGADAIYIGGPAFGARKEASNTIEDIKEICTFAHYFGARVHVTINTLLYDNELEECQEIINKLGDAGIDAIIFQDLAITKMQIPKGIELHASTQCDISTLDKLKFYSTLNISQVVLPREFSLTEISDFHKELSELKYEVFVAGALCVGQSGICHISDYMTGRSANRGACAQICRLPMVIFDKNDNKIATGHLLSMKDNFLIDELEDLINAGVSSFKIEGRLKDKDYVVNMVSRFSKRLDEIIAKSKGTLTRVSYGKSEYNFKANEYKTFNRGFTNEMLHGLNVNLVNIKSPKSQGELIGTIKSVKVEGNETSIEVALKDKDLTISNNDGFAYFDKSDEQKGFMCNKALVNGKNAKIYIFGKRRDFKLGSPLYRNEDTLFKKIIARKDACTRRVDVSAEIRLDDITFIKDGREYQASAFTLEFKDRVGAKGSDTIEFTHVGEGESERVSSDLATAKALHSDQNLNGKVPSELSLETMCAKLFKLGSPYHRLTEIVFYKNGTLLKTFDLERTPENNDLVGDGKGHSNSKDKVKAQDDIESKLSNFFTDNKALFADFKVYLPISRFNDMRRQAFTLYLKEKKQVRADFIYKNPDYTVPYPEDSIDKRLVLNKTTRKVYEDLGVDFNKECKKIVSRSVMTCKNCLIKNHALCKKDGGSTLGYYIVIGKDRFDILCDCVHCKMHLVLL